MLSESADFDVGAGSEDLRCDGNNMPVQPCDQYDSFRDDDDSLIPQTLGSRASCQ